jgi:hypothetical protein
VLATSCSDISAIPPALPAMGIVKSFLRGRGSANDQRLLRGMIEPRNSIFESTPDPISGSASGCYVPTHGNR